MEKIITIKKIWLGKESANGKTYNSIVTTEDEFFNDFKELFTKGITLAEGKHYKIKYMSKGDFKNPLAIEESDTPPATQPMEIPTNTQPSVNTPQKTVGDIENLIAARMQACKEMVEGIYGLPVKEMPEIIPCINSCFIEMNRRIR